MTTRQLAAKRRVKAERLLVFACRRHQVGLVVDYRAAAVDALVRRLKREEQLRFTIRLYENICQRLKREAMDAIE